MDNNNYLTVIHPTTGSAPAPQNTGFVNEVIDSLKPGELGRAIGVSPTTLTDFRKKGRFPVSRCAAIEVATNGKYTRAQLRPDHFGVLDYDINPSQIETT
jgi:hypothetical protein